MERKDSSLIDKINPIFITLTATAIHHCLLALKTGNFEILPDLGPGGGVQCMYDTRNINHVVNTTYTDVFRCLDADFCSFSPDVQAKKIDNIHCKIHQIIHSTGKEQAMAQHNNNQESFHEDFLDYVQEELIELPDNSFDSLSSFVADAEASMQCSAILPMGRSAIASSSQRVPYSNSNSNSNSSSNNITNIINIASVENTGLVDKSKVLEGTRSFGG